MIMDALATLLSLSERLEDEARVESVVVWSLKILTVVSAATTTTLSALPGFNMGATIAGAVTVALTTIQLRRKSEDIAAFVEDLIVNVGNGRDAPEPETATKPETQQLGAQPSEAVV